jgi:hypothetical protein
MVPASRALRREPPVGRVLDPETRRGTSLQRTDSAAGAGRAADFRLHLARAGPGAPEVVDRLRFRNVGVADRDEERARRRRLAPRRHLLGQGRSQV